jgi:hypothetical protein
MRVYVDRQSQKFHVSCHLSSYKQNQEKVHRNLPFEPIQSDSDTSRRSAGLRHKQTISTTQTQAGDQHGLWKEICVVLYNLYIGSYKQNQEKVHRNLSFEPIQSDSDTSRWSHGLWKEICVVLYNLYTGIGWINLKMKGKHIKTTQIHYDSHSHKSDRERHMLSWCCAR